MSDEAEASAEASTGKDGGAGEDNTDEVSASTVNGFKV